MSMLLCISCQRTSSQEEDKHQQAIQDSIERVRQAEEAERNRPRTADDITLIKDLTFDNYVLEDKYEYQDIFECFSGTRSKND